MGKPQTHTLANTGKPTNRTNAFQLATPPPALRRGRKLIESAVVICRCGGPKMYENEMPHSAFPLFRSSAFPHSLGTCVYVESGLYACEFVCVKEAEAASN